MKSPQKPILASEFWRSISFHSLSTYSLLRGPKMHEFDEQNEAAIAETKEQITTARFMEKIKLEKKLEILERNKIHSNLYLLDEGNNFHPTAEIKQVFEPGSQDIKMLEEIFSITDEEVVSTCMPVYRDAIVFYNKEKKIVSALNLCFGCLAMVSNDGKFVLSGISLYKRLKDFLISQGHPIANIPSKEHF